MERTQTVVRTHTVFDVHDEISKMDTDYDGAGLVSARAWVVKTSLI